MGLIKNLVKKVVGGGAPAKPSSSATPAPPASPKVASPKPARGGTNAESDTPWYLDGQNDGWEDTDVDPAKKG